MRPPFNQPKLYTTLLSEPHGTNYAVYSMVALDEITRRTPDALLTGEATKKIITHCCPDIIEPDNLLSCDIQHLLATIQIASTGPKIEFIVACPKCANKDTYEINLSLMINSLTAKLWNESFEIPYEDQSLKIFIHPHSYKEFNEFSKNDFRLKKQIYQITQLESIDGYEEMLSSLSTAQKNNVLTYQFNTLEKIVIDNNIVVNEKQYLEEWFTHIDRQLQKKITDYIVSAEKQAYLPDMNISCPACGNNYYLPIDLDFGTQFRNKLIVMTENEIISEIEHMSKDNKKLSDDLLKIIWYMRGSISYSESVYLTIDDRTTIMEIRKENIETSKKCGFPVI